jgi:hypothetical protein
MIITQGTIVMFAGQPLGRTTLEIEVVGDALRFHILEPLALIGGPDCVPTATSSTHNNYIRHVCDGVVEVFSSAGVEVVAHSLKNLLGLSSQNPFSLEDIDTVATAARVILSKQQVPYELERYLHYLTRS